MINDAYVFKESWIENFNLVPLPRDCMHWEWAKGSGWKLWRFKCATECFVQNSEVSYFSEWKTDSWWGLTTRHHNYSIHNLHGVVRHLLFHLTAKQKTIMIVIYCRTVCTTQRHTPVHGITVFRYTGPWRHSPVSFLNRYYSRRHADPWHHSVCCLSYVNT